MRNAFARTIYELAKRDERVCVLVADISPAGAMEELRREFPDRFINVGVAEQAMIGLAAGMAARGMRPFCYTIATFALFRAYEFIRCDLAYQNLPVTVVGMGAGLTYPTLGGTHQAIEDVAVAMACPGMTVLAPCDPPETVECVAWCARREGGGPVYLRLGKAGEPTLTADLAPWAPGELRWLRARRSTHIDSVILTYGPIATVAVEVADALGPTTAVAVVSSVSAVDATSAAMREMRRPVIVIEEASGAPLASALALQGVEGVRSFCLSRDFVHMHGSRAELLNAVGLTAEKIVAALRGH